MAASLEPPKSGSASTSFTEAGFQSPISGEFNGALTAGIMDTEDFPQGRVFPTSLVSGWRPSNISGTSIGTAVTATSSPTDQPANFVGYRVMPREQGLGTTLRVRVRYPTGATITQQLAYRVLGRKRPVPGDPNAGYAWQILPNRLGATDPSITCAPGSDLTTGTMQVSASDVQVNSHDCDGCNDFMVVPTTGLAMTGADVTKAFLEIKIL